MHSIPRPDSRFILAVLVVATACGARSATPSAPTEPAIVTAARAEPAAAQQQQQPAAPKPPTEEEIKQLSHALLDAYDRGDAAAVEPRLAPEFLHFEGGHGVTRDEELAQLVKRRESNAFIASRTWEEERVRIHTDSAVFTGKATERQGGDDKKGGYKYVGWYLLEWVRSGDAWQARLWRSEG